MTDKYTDKEGTEGYSNDYVSFIAMLAFVFTTFLAFLIVETFTYNVPKRSWSCTELSKPTSIGDKVHCLQYTKDKP